MKGPPVKISQRKLFCKVGKLSHGWGNYNMVFTIILLFKGGFLGWESKTYMLFGIFGPDGGFVFRDQSVNVVRAFLSLAGNASILVHSSFFGGPRMVGIAWGLLIIDFRMERPSHWMFEHFCNPASISLAPTKWQKFTSNLMVVLNTFEAQPLKAATFSIKYLTSSKLMGLELKDPSFRRHILVQCLILFDYLKAPGKNDKDLPSDSMLLCHVVGWESTHYILRLAYGSSLQNNKGLGCDGGEILEKAHSMEEAIPLNTLIRSTLSSLPIYFMTLFVISNKIHGKKRGGSKLGRKVSGVLASQDSFVIENLKE
ncbi:hypothetical protein AAG906_021880 [Vitis piasezkii]